MRKYFLITCIFLSLSVLGFSQQIKITLKNSNDTKPTLYKLAGEKILLVDSGFVKRSGKFIYNGENLSTGFYQLRIADNRPIIFIYSGDDIELKVDAKNIGETIEVIKSKSNEIYYEFEELNKDYKTKTELLQLILARYPKDDDYYRTTINKVDHLQKEYAAFIDNVVSIDPSSFISGYVQSSQLPIVNFTLSIEEQIDYLKSHALDKVNFNDAELIHSDCFTNKSIEYLTYYRNLQLPKELLEEEFKKAVDTLLTKASVNILVYEHITDYLIDGFKQFSFDNVVDYIVENYVVKDNICLDEQTENSIEHRINQSKLLKLGTTAPNIVLPDTSGNLIDVSKIDKEKILLLFYASWCPHCQDLLPKIYNLSKQRNDLKVVAISFDEDREAWTSYLKENGFDWINLSDLKGWESQAAQDYYIYATPTMFLLNEKREIIGKPLQLAELINYLGAE